MGRKGLGQAGWDLESDSQLGAYPLTLQVSDLAGRGGSCSEGTPAIWAPETVQGSSGVNGRGLSRGRSGLHAQSFQTVYSECCFFLCLTYDVENIPTWLQHLEPTPLRSFSENAAPPCSGAREEQTLFLQCCLLREASQVPWNISQNPASAHRAGPNQISRCKDYASPVRWRNDLFQTDWRPEAGRET